MVNKIRVKYLKQRLEAFSDGVFAIVITLLILDIKIPNVSPAELPAGLVKILPQLLTYVLSFFIVGLYWYFHHLVAAQIKLIDESFIWLNLMWLLFVGVNLILVNVTGFIILAYLQRRPHLRHQPMSVAELRAGPLAGADTQ